MNTIYIVLQIAPRTERPVGQSIYNIDNRYMYRSPDTRIRQTGRFVYNDSLLYWVRIRLDNNSRSCVSSASTELHRSRLCEVKPSLDFCLSSFSDVIQSFSLISVARISRKIWERCIFIAWGIPQAKIYCWWKLFKKFGQFRNSTKSRE